MIAREAPFMMLVRILAPLVWRTDAKIAAKLAEFSATEAGSALDMLKAAELADNPAHRRLFFRHAMDEATHARLFRSAARCLDADPERRASPYAAFHARRQNLFQRLGPERFLAFVHLAELRGRSHFLALEEHFQDRPELLCLFSRIAKEELFHVRYSARLLGNGAPARRALLFVRVTRAWDAWRRLGHRLGDRLAQAFLILLYLVAIPPFAVLQRLFEPERTGWKKKAQVPVSWTDARRSF